MANPTNTFLIIASFVLALYVILVFVLFLPMIGFATIPILVISLFAGIAIVGSILYNNYDPSNDFIKGDEVSIIVLVTVLIIVFVVVMFVMWLIYTQYTKPVSKDRQGLDFEEHWEDIDPEAEKPSPFGMDTK